MSNIDSIKQAIHTYLDMGISVVPLGENKTPVVTGWRPLQEHALTRDEVDRLFNGERVRTSSGDGMHMFKPPHALAVICGKVSSNIEVLDVDCKHDLTGTLYQDLTDEIKAVLPGVYKRLVVIRTRSGGYHLPYRAINLQGNLKLANRNTTPQEREERYQEAITAGRGELIARRDADAYTQEVLLETRGQGGYVVAPPSPGYEFIQGDYNTLPELTPQERDTLLNIARGFNQVPELAPLPKVTHHDRGTPSSGILSPFEDYNTRADVLDLLERHGWSIVRNSGERVHVLRPGHTDTLTSGNYHTGLRLLQVFSSSTPFTPGKAYNPVQVYTILEHAGDYAAASRELYRMGYGQRRTSDTAVPLAHVQVDAINRNDTTMRVVAHPGGVLTGADVKAITTGEDVVIHSPGDHAQDEVEAVLDSVMRSRTRVYVVEDGVQVAAYTYKLNAILHRYDKVQDEHGGILPPAQLHALLDEVVRVKIHLEPMHRDLYRAAFLSHPGIQELGITPKALKDTEKRLQHQAAQDEQAASAAKLHHQVGELITKGDTTKVVDVIRKAARELTTITKVEEYQERMRPFTREDMITAMQSRADSIPSGYKLNNHEVMLPAAGISIYAARTKHGKTTMLINTLLHLVKLEQYQEKAFHFITYEMDKASIMSAILNTYLGCDIARNNHEAIEAYYKSGGTDTSLMRADRVQYFLDMETRFYQELIEPGRIRVHHVNDTSGELADFIAHLYEEHGNIGAVFIDYIQLMDAEATPGARKAARHEEVKDICKQLMVVAKDTGLPIVAAAQFNRTVQHHLDLDASRISEASDIEKSAALILGAWNNDFKPNGTEEELKQISKDGMDMPGTMYIQVLAARWAKSGDGDVLTWHGNSKRIGVAPPPPQEPKKINTYKAVKV